MSYRDLPSPLSQSATAHHYPPTERSYPSPPSPFLSAVGSHLDPFESQDLTPTAPLAAMFSKQGFCSVD